MTGPACLAPVSWEGLRQQREGRCQDMATEDKAAHKATELKGKVKEGVGDATDDNELKAEGQADQAKGNLKQAGDKVKDAFKK
jgi:uncharacterized protein YjbJ (UPF0337 family)